VISYIYVFTVRRPMRVYNGRVCAMKSNVRLLKKRLPRNRLRRYILSTRVSFWPSSENENARNEFRNLLTQKIQSGIIVQRIWQMHGLEDLDKMRTYLELYKNHDNYSLKCFIGTNTYIPEILSIGGSILSISIPQLSDPRRLTTDFHFRGKNEIRRWEDYFRTLWEESIPIKIGPKISQENLDSLNLLVMKK
jgi:hypothetical protein